MENKKNVLISSNNFHKFICTLFENGLSEESVVGILGILFNIPKENARDFVFRFVSKTIN